MTFFFGYKLGLDSSLNDSSISLSQNEVICPQTTIQSENNQQLQLNEQQNLPEFLKQIKTINDNHNYYKVHKNGGQSVVDLVFHDLYHPGTMSKAEFILSSLKHWIVIKNNTTHVRCKEMYHTRTGSRTNQPAKCVSIVTVQDGQQSPWITTNRYGFTAGSLPLPPPPLPSLSLTSLHEQGKQINI